MIGFLIINYNDAPTTKKLLDNVKNYDCLSKILVVDNGSSDDSYVELKKYENDKIEVLQRLDGRNFGAGINFGLRHLKKEGILYSFVSNSDVEISSSLDLEKIIAYKEKGKVIGPVIKEHTGYNRGWKVPSNFQLFLLSLPFIYRFFISWNHYSDDFYQGSFQPVEVVSFCFFFVSILELEKVGYLDETVFLYFEENIMAQKLEKKGIYLCNEVQVFHNHSVTINKNLRRAHKYLALSKSRRYFAKVYNHANFLLLLLMWIVEKMTFAALKIVDFICFHF